MDLFFCDKAGEVIALLRDGIKEYADEPESIVEHLNECVDELIKIFAGDFNYWTLVLNIVQDWFSQNHQAFEGIRHIISTDRPMIKELGEAVSEMPPCLNPYLWKTRIWELTHDLT